MVYRIGIHPDRPERLCVMAPDGRVVNTRAYDETLDEVKSALIHAGIAFTVDDEIR